MNSIRMRFPCGLAKAFSTSYDDGVEQDVRLIEIMRKNGVKGTFNLGAGCFACEDVVYPAGQVHRRMPLSRCLAVYQGNDLEVAVHGFTHPYLEALPTAAMVGEVLDDRRSLENAFGTIIRGMAYPYGTYSDDVVAALKLCGIAYSRTVEAHLSFSIPRDWLRMGATCHHNHPKCNALMDEFLAGKPSREPWLFYLWGHSYEFEADDNWDLIEGLLEKVGGREDVWYATNIEIHDYVKAYEALIYSADGSACENPTAKDVWIECTNRGVGKKTIRIPAGKAIRLP